MTTTLDRPTQLAPEPSSSSDGLLPVAYVLTGLSLLAGIVGYAIPDMVPVYLAAVLWLVVTLGYVLPRSARAINERSNVGGAVVAIILSLVFVPPVLAVSFTATAAAAVGDAFEDVSDDLDLSELSSDEGVPDEVTPDGSSHDDECEQTYYDTDWGLAELDECLLEND